MMRKAINKKAGIFYIWVGLAYLLLWVVIDLANYPDHFLPRIINNIWLAIYISAVSFIFFEYTVPFLQQKRKNIFTSTFLSLLASIALLLLFSFGIYGWRFTGIQLHIYTSLKAFASVGEGVLYIFPHGVASVFFFGILKHIYDYTKLKQAAQQLRIEKQETELNYLRSQTNPHFLFNTLNNIYSLARDSSDQAPESVLRLSKILRFMLYETSGEFIAIEDELKIISDYIALEKLRYDNSLRINFNYDVEDMKQPIPPLLMIPLVENAFKHGVSETRDHPFIDIHLSVDKRRLVFSVKNSAEVSPERSVRENIGLSNLRRQLQLLYTDHDLFVQQKGSLFTVVLKIDLASHV